MIARLIVLLAAAGIASTATAQSASQLENAMGGKTFRCDYTQRTDPNNVTGGSTLVVLQEGGQATVRAPDANNAEDRSGISGRWWADGGMTLCMDLGSGAQCGIADPNSPNQWTLMTANGQVPCTAQ